MIYCKLGGCGNASRHSKKQARLDANVSIELEPVKKVFQWVAAVTPTSTIAHKGMVTGAKVLAASMLDLLPSPELLQRARHELAEATQESPYFTLLPAGAKPPTYLN